MIQDNVLVRIVMVVSAFVVLMWLIDRAHEPEGVVIAQVAAHRGSGRGEGVPTTLDETLRLLERRQLSGSSY
jgi:hypothetical protein